HHGARVGEQDDRDRGAHGNDAQHTALRRLAAAGSRVLYFGGSCGSRSSSPPTTGRTCWLGLSTARCTRRAWTTRSSSSTTARPTTPPTSSPGSSTTGSPCSATPTPRG